MRQYERTKRVTVIYGQVLLPLNKVDFSQPDYFKSFNNLIGYYEMRKSSLNKLSLALTVTRFYLVFKSFYADPLACTFVVPHHLKRI